MLSVCRLGGERAGGLSVAVQCCANWVSRFSVTSPLEHLQSPMYVPKLSTTKVSKHYITNHLKILWQRKIAQTTMYLRYVTVPIFKQLRDILVSLVYDDLPGYSERLKR
jgi:hypothetical protein